ncbi:MAG TPA: hypothetical protein VHU91_05650 [Mycobacteriales bacterium]|nr:hypothetical protein [Mycobacteriales bacterium]
MRKRILIVSARIGAGHDGAARELARRLSSHQIEHADFLDLLPGQLGKRLCSAYHHQLEWLPRSWDWLLRGLSSPGAAGLAVRASALACRNLSALITPATDLVISTYPLASHAMAHLRSRENLPGSFAVYLTDPSVHRLCVSPTADLHIAPNPTAARQTRRFGASRVEIAAPVVGPGFHPAASKAEYVQARGSFGLPQDRRLALVVAGSWGVGEVEQIARDVTRSGVAQPVVVCGRNTALLHRLQQAGYPHIFGWIADMARLMRACDVVVQNAGGLTTSEALTCGLPVLTYRCLPGHGRANARVLDEEGLVPWVRSPEGLPAALVATDPPRSFADRDPAPLLEKLLNTAKAAA